MSDFSVDSAPPFAPLISVIIPTLDEAAAIAATIQSVRVHSPAYEIIVVDAGSTDETAPLAQSSGARVIACPQRQRAAQMNLGAAEARGEVLLFLHADTRLQPESLPAIRDALRDPRVVGGAFARRYESPSRVLAVTCWLASLRNRFVGWHLGDQAIFVRREVFQHCGGFAPVDVFEDLDFSRKLGRYGEVVTLQPPVVSAARRFSSDGPLLRTLKDFLLTCRYLARGSVPLVPRADLPESAPAKSWLSNHRKWIVLAVALLIFSSAAKHLFPLDVWITALAASLEGRGPAGALVFGLIYAVATVLFIPGSLLTITAGLIFGVGLGTLVAWSGAVLGSSLSFLIGRHLARGKIEAKTKSNEQFRAIDEAIGEQGWKIIGLLRLSPLIPFSISNYFYGITKVGFWPYVAASSLGMLPGTLLYVYLGAIGRAGFGSEAKQQSPLQWLFLAVGLLATIGVTIWVSRIAKAALRKTGAAGNEEAK